MTGALVVILFSVEKGEIVYSWTWFCADPDEEDLMEERLGVIEPGSFLYDGILSGAFSDRGGKAKDCCSSLVEKIPDAWLYRFPDGLEIVRLTFELLAGHSSSPDERVMTRRECEYRIFRAIEAEHVLPKIKLGFESVDAFIELANAVTNRRKSRSGKSFEYHLERIFTEDGLPCTRGGKTEGKKTPDFLFPSVDSYHDLVRDSAKLRMLGVKTTCKDRWRQILNEADRIPPKHLITLQEGISIDQYREMEAASVVLVVPERLRKKYPEKIQPSIMTLEKFIAETKVCCLD
jgi:hypothetical protein